MTLPDVLSARGDRLIHLASVDSTMLEALRLLSNRNGQTIWIVADEQLAGRGRLSRSWSSPPGNLYMTIVMTAPAPLRVLALAGYAAGLALHQAASDVLGNAEGLALKWPNDLLLNGAKVSGLLMEAHEDGQTLAIGIGLNITSHPSDTPYPATHLSAHGKRIDRDHAFHAVAGRLTETLGIFGDGSGFPLIRQKWLVVAAMLNKQVTIRLAERTLEGIHRGIDEDGRFLLEADNTVTRIDAGDVFPLDITAKAAHQTDQI